MAEVLQISQLGNPVLRQIAQPVDNLHSSEMQRLIDRLMATLVQSNGVGIAAPQVAASVQLLIVASRPNPRYPNAPQMEPTVMVNPRLISHDEAQVKDWEGCLSIPGIRGLVPRYKEIEVEYFDRDGNPHRRVLTDFVARIFQHEADHLVGKVFLDRLESTHDIITDQEYLTRVLNQP
ncbi:peptide deformylase [Leptolyngbya ohadii]|uniref:peptide deformylase n=1 Tax=Leptolyngbya ohadii TaxID=1962290 RepID=UPI000B59CAE2|nr:peptide deformylase [Leptolyngbya ohadii]